MSFTYTKKSLQHSWVIHKPKNASSWHIVGFKSSSVFEILKYICIHMCYFEYTENMGFNFLRLELHILLTLMHKSWSSSLKAQYGECTYVVTNVVFFLRLDIFKFQPCQYKKNFHNAFTYYGTTQNIKSIVEKVLF